MSEPETVQKPLQSLRKRAIHGTVMTLGGVGLSHVLRLGGNLLLARLLFPEAFGIMAIINMFTQGLNMFSDIGIRPAIIQHPRGGEESFLNTAWTIQIIRGIALAVCLCILAWPISRAYGEPQLLSLLPFVGINSALAALSLTAIAHLNRQLILGRQILIDLAGQLASLVTMVVFALIHPSVWALVFGGTASALVSVALSHFALPGIRHRLSWDEQSRKELFGFGRWITMSTAFTFLSMQADRLILSTFTTMAMIGLYSVASNLSQVAVMIGSKLTGSVLFPLYATWGRESKARLEQQLYRARIRVMALFLIPPALLVAFGGPVVELLYDDRYREAGWMLSLLSLAVIPQVITMTADPVFLAVGDSYRHMVLTIARGISSLVCLAIGGYLAGVRGLIIGSIFANVVPYPFLVRGLRAHGCWMPWLDLAAVAYAGTLILVGRLLLSLFT